MGFATENIGLLKEYEGTLSPKRVRQARWESFFRGKQYTRKEKNQLIQYGLIPLVINVCRPLLGQRRAIITSSRPTWKVVPLQGASKLIAEALQQYLVGKWNADYIDTELNLAITDMVITGDGFLLVDLASFLDNSTFDINIRRVPWKFVYPDPNAQNFDLSDAENIIIRKTVSLKRAQVLYQMTESEAMQAAVLDGASSAKRDVYQQPVEVIDRYSKYPCTKIQVAPKEGEMLRGLPTVFYTTDLQDKIAKEQRKLRDDMRKLYIEDKIQLKEMRELHIYRNLSVGQFDKYAGIMNIRDYPVIYFCNEHGGTFLDSLGETGFVEGIQKAINKFYLLTIHNAMLTGNVRVMGPKDAVKDKTQFQKTAALPGAYLAWTPDPTLPDGGKPEILQGGQLSSAFYGLVNDLFERAKFETSVYSPQLGDPKNSPETFSTTASLQEFGSQTIKEVARRVDIQIAKAGEVVIQFIQNYTKKDELIEYLDVHGNLTGLLPGPEGQNQKLNEIVLKEGVVAEIKNNTRIGKYAVKVLTQPNLGTDRLIHSAVMRDMIMNKAIPPIPEIMRPMLDMMEFPGAEKIVSSMQQSADAQQQLQALSEMNKELSNKLASAEQESMKNAKRVELAQFETQLAKHLLQIQTSGKDAIRKLESEVEKVSLEMEKSNGQSTKEE